VIPKTWNALTESTHTHTPTQTLSMIMAMNTKLHTLFTQFHCNLWATWRPTAVVIWSGSCMPGGKKSFVNWSIIDCSQLALQTYPVAMDPGCEAALAEHVNRLEVCGMPTAQRPPAKHQAQQPYFIQGAPLTSYIASTDYGWLREQSHT
jgi:hypothetical protein